VGGAEYSVGRQKGGFWGNQGGGRAKIFSKETSGGHRRVGISTNGGGVVLKKRGGFGPSKKSSGTQGHSQKKVGSKAGKKKKTKQRVTLWDGRDVFKKMTRQNWDGGEKKSLTKTVLKENRQKGKGIIVELATSKKEKKALGEASQPWREKVFKNTLIRQE